MSRVLTFPASGTLLNRSKAFFLVSMSRIVADIIKRERPVLLATGPSLQGEGEEKDGMSLTLSILQSAHGNGVSRTLRLDDKGNDMVRRGFETATRPDLLHSVKSPNQCDMFAQLPQSLRPLACASATVTTMGFLIFAALRQL